MTTPPHRDRLARCPSKPMDDCDCGWCKVGRQLATLATERDKAEAALALAVEWIKSRQAHERYVRWGGEDSTESESLWDRMGEMDAAVTANATLAAMMGEGR